ncbi:MAG: DUF4097 family beta strand repeat-containing protein [Terriglobia bacterium]
MRNMKSVAISAIALAVLTLGIAGIIPAQDNNPYRQEFHQTYPLNPTGQLSLENINGSVQITGWDRNEVKVDAVKSASSQDTLDRIKIDVESSPNGVYIKTEFPNHLFEHDGNWRVNYTLMVPKRAAIDKVDLVNGGLVVRNISGDVRASSVNGPIDARDLSGAVHLSAVNGPVEASFSNQRLSDPVSVSTVNGPITVTLPPGVHASVIAKTINGGIDNSFGMQVTGRLVGHSLEGSIGNGGSQIDLKSVNGAVHIRSNSQEVE